LKESSVKGIAAKVALKKASRGSKKKPLNLDSLDDEGGLDEEEEQAEKHLNEYAKLEELLTKCQKCGPDIWCKVNKHGAHIALNTLQLSGWATALVRPLFLLLLIF
jgi:hypothetical protein